MVNAVLLEKEKVLRTARAEAGLLRAKAVSEAQEIVLTAQNAGFKFLFEATNITEQKHRMALAGPSSPPKYVSLLNLTVCS